MSRLIIDPSRTNARRLSPDANTVDAANAEQMEPPREAVAHKEKAVPRTSGLRGERRGGFGILVLGGLAEERTSPIVVLASGLQ
jgi:hypothetical protein